MTQPYPGQSSPPRPGPPPTPVATEPSRIDPSQIGRDVADFTAQVDELRRTAQDRGIDLSTLDAQAELLERAHDVLTATLEHLDRV